MIVDKYGSYVRKFMREGSYIRTLFLKIASQQLETNNLYKLLFLICYWLIRKQKTSLLYAS
jgi:hypothetical protein